MSAGPDIDDEDGDGILAAEVALGVLTGPEAAAAAAREASDPAFAAEVAQWRERLAPLADDIAPVTPPPDVLRRVELRLFGPETATAPAPWALLDRLRGLVFGALAGAVAVAVLAVGLALVLAPAPPPERRAEIAATDGSLLLNVRLESGAVRVERLAGAAPPGRVLQLWLVADGSSPVSLGVLPETQVARLDLPAGLRLPTGALLAVSEEPPGGSPTGLPTGAVLAGGAITEG